MTPQITRRRLLTRLTHATAGMAALRLTSLLHAQAAAGGPRPNILYIMSDDHAAHAVSAYGSKINQTPNIDRIAKGGMRLDNCFVTNALCGPSRATLVTGKYSHANSFRDNKPGTKFDNTQATFPKMLQKAGYQTAMIGKWHLNSDPTGFDYWCQLQGQGRYNNPIFFDMGKRTVVNGYVTDIITDKSIDWIDKRDKTKPFLLLCHHKAPHREWTPDAKHAQMYPDDVPEPATFNDDYSTRTRAAHEQDMTVEKTLTKTDTKGDPPADLKGEALKKWKYQRFIKDYLRCIASVDDNVGRLLDYLDKQNLADNTIVVYTADNGFFLGDHGWFDKRFMYEESLRVPFLIRYPGHIAPNTINKDLVLNVDYAPTFLDYAGAEIPKDMQGRSLRPVLEGHTPDDWRKSAYYHYYEFPQPHHVQPHYGLRTERYKLIYFYDLNEWELYDLQYDPNELKNLYNDPDHAKIRDELKTELLRQRQAVNDKDGPDPK